LRPPREGHFLEPFNDHGKLIGAGDVAAVSHRVSLSLF